MSCNSCSKSFSLLRPEKGCPGCGFSYCAKCLKEKIFLKKINSEAKVCPRCKRLGGSEEPKVTDPPDVYYKRIGAVDGFESSKTSNATDQQILDRLTKLKTKDERDQLSIESRLQKLKGDTPSTSDAELQLRLANIKGISYYSPDRKLICPASKSDQEQVDDLLKQYEEQTNIDTKYNEEFDGVINDIERRLQSLKGSSSANTKLNAENTSPAKCVSETEEMDHNDIVNIIAKAKKDVIEDDDTILDVKNIEELPFCEICNEDAKMRCLGCKYLFCKRCFIEHKDDDDGCDKYELYSHKS